MKCEPFQLPLHFIVLVFMRRAELFNFYQMQSKFLKVWHLKSTNELNFDNNRDLWKVCFSHSTWFLSFFLDMKQVHDFSESLWKFSRLKSFKMASGAGQRVLSQQQNNQPLGPNPNILNRGPDAALLKPSIKTSITGKNNCCLMINFRQISKFQIW